MENGVSSFCMFHSHLKNMGLFDDNSKDYVLANIALNSPVYKVFLPLINKNDPNQNPINVPFDDVQSMHWILHIKSFYIFYSLLNPSPDVYQTAISVITNFYYKFIIELNPKMSSDDFNSIVSQMILHLSLTFDIPRVKDSKPAENSEELSKHALRIFGHMILKPQNYYSQETMRALFKIIIGLCDFVVNDVKNEALFDLMFWTLIKSNDKENWTLFNEITSKWKHNQLFIDEWLKYFNTSFRTSVSTHATDGEYDLFLSIVDSNLQFHMTVDESIKTIVQLIKNAKAISKTENSEVLPHAFGTISDCVSQLQPSVTDYFRLRWYIDEILSLFSSWQKEDTKSSYASDNTIISMMKIFESSLIREGSVWMSALINDIKKELKNTRSTIIRDLLKEIGCLLCAHPNDARGLIEPTISCLKERIKMSPQQFRGDPLISSLLLSIAELEYCMNNHTSILPVVDILYDTKDVRGMSDKSNPTWQMQLITFMTVNSITKFNNNCVNASKISAPAEYFVYLLFAPQFMPDLLSSIHSDILVDSILNEAADFSVETNPDTMIPFFNTVYEYSVCSHLFSPMSNERNKLMAIINSKEGKIPRDLVNFVAVASLAGAQPIEPSVAHRIEEENKEFIIHFQGNDSIFSFIDDPSKELSFIVRSVVGCFAFNVSDTGNIQEVDTLPDITADSDNEGTFEIEEDFAELAELLNTVKPLEFTVPTHKFEAKHQRVFSFLASSGVIGCYNERDVLDIENVDSFIEEFDSIPAKDTIEIGILHFTQKSCEMPGSRKLTPLFNTFLMSLGKFSEPYKSFKHPIVQEMASMRFVYLHLEEDSNVDELMNAQMIIVFNETDYKCNETKFCSLAPLIISVEPLKLATTRNDMLVRMDLMIQGNKFNRSIAYPLIHKCPRLLSKKHFLPTFSLMAAIGVAKQKEKSILGETRRRRKEAIDKVYKKDVIITKILDFPFKNED